MSKKVRDKDRRSISQKEVISVRISEETKKKIAAIALREHRTLGSQAALYIERALENAAA